MAHTWVSTVKLPGDSTAREIVPYKVGVSNSSDVVVTLPSTLDTNAEFIVNKGNQDIEGWKYFKDGIGFYDAAKDGYFTVKMHDYTLIVGDSGYNLFKVDIFNRYIWWGSENDQTAYTYTFPNTSGTFAIKDDITITGVTDGLFDLKVSNKNLSVSAWASANKAAGRFYLGTTIPTNTTRLNYDGYFYAKRLYVGSTEVTVPQIEDWRS